jgi:hypothetical protein
MTTMIRGMVRGMYQEMMGSKKATTRLRTKPAGATRARIL